jgi:hypothetical protein
MMLTGTKTALSLPAWPCPPHTPASDDRQSKLLSLVRDMIAKLDPNLSQHALNYVRVIKGPAPSILEVECAEVTGWVLL